MNRPASQAPARRIILGLGSNQNATANLRRCLAALETRFGAVRASVAYQSDDVTDTAGAGALPAFVNLVVTFKSEATPAELQAWCKAQERAQGRLSQSAGARTHPVDIDLLAVGELCVEFIDHSGRPIPLPHGDILRYAFVLRPLAELVPDARHPHTGVTYAELWASARATASPRLTPICWPSAAPL